MFSGWPAFYKFFFDRYHWTLAEVNACPIYLACILLGALSPDHMHVRMTFQDALRYYADDGETLQVLSRLASNPGRIPVSAHQ